MILVCGQEVGYPILAGGSLASSAMLFMHCCAGPYEKSRNCGAIGGRLSRRIINLRVSRRGNSVFVRNYFCIALSVLLIVVTLDTGSVTSAQVQNFGSGMRGGGI